MKRIRFYAICFLTVILIIAFGFNHRQTIQGAGDVQSQPILVPPAIQLQLVAGSLSSPVYVTHARDSRLFIVEQTGLIRIFQSGSVLATPFLDLTTLRLSGGERGVLGLAFHPNYPTTPYFFVHFTSNGTALPDGTDPNSGDNVIVRYTVSANPNVATFGSARTLLVIPNPFSNHNGGMIEFGGDGNLYIGKRDGGSANDPGNRAQNINELLGKILRIAPDVSGNNALPPYTNPPGNPFIGIAGRDEIYLVGLRNPWRFSFDRGNGDLWIGDVGQGAREEIDRFIFGTNVPGSNLGWRIFEGTQCTGLDSCVPPPANYLPPLAEYNHTGGRCSLTGGYVYRGTQITGLIGSYVYADYCTGEIFRLVGTTQELMLDTTHNISSFGEDSAGELYITALGGQVYRIAAVPTAASAFVSGRIISPKGRGIGNVVLSLSGGGLTVPLVSRTNPFGFYQFPELETGQTYTITPTAKGTGFQPSNRTFTLWDEVRDADFITAPN